MNNRPSNWHEMSWNEQREWQREQQRVADLEYDNDRVRRELEDHQAHCARQARARKAEQEETRSEIESLNEERWETQAELNMVREFIEAKGLAQEFEAWSDEHRLAEDKARSIDAPLRAWLAQGNGCIHTDPGNICTDCLEEYAADPSAWFEFGSHAKGEANHKALMEEIAAETKADAVPAAEGTEDEIPF